MLAIDACERGGWGIMGPLSNAGLLVFDQENEVLNQ